MRSYLTLLSILPWPLHRGGRRFPLLPAAGLVILVGLAPVQTLACACGCSVFDVGSSTLLPKEGDHGGVVYFEWDHSNQNQNWSGLSKAPAADNGDKRIFTDWFVVGGEYMLNRSWGVQVRLPYATRAFTTDTNFGNPGGPDIETFRTQSFGDLEVSAMYTGFSNVLSTGVWLGLKLPTGNFTATGLDRDTQLGTGSTDVILGAFHRGMITGDNAWQYFSQIKLLQPIATQSAYDSDAGTELNYRPGTQLDGALGITYNNWYHVGPFDKIAPVFQLIGSHRQPDGGLASDPYNTGYDRLFVSPGLEFTKVLDDPENKTLRVYGDVEIPVYQRVNGNQITAPVQYKVIAAFTF